MPSPTAPTPGLHAGLERRSRRRRRRAVVAALGLVALLLTGCGSDDAATSATSETTPPLEQVVRIVDHELVPDTVEVPVGDTVRWENQDPVDHELVSLDSDVIRSPVLGKAATYSVRFTAPGEYPYYCNIHNYMKGTVVVR